MIINTTDNLKDVCQRFAAYPYITIDTEFIREKTYYPDLCLVQIASRDEAFCVDPLAPDMDLKPLFELLQNQNVVKVFHAARQDIEILLHLSGQIPNPVFDTQIGAMVCGFGVNSGYSQLVSAITGVKLDKSMRCTNWAKRPLTPEQIQYALYDVTYLRDVYEYIKNYLEKSGRIAWIQDELAMLTNRETYEPSLEHLFQKIHCPLTKPLAVYVYRQLYLWREKLAQLKNRPRRFLIKDELLIELALVRPHRVEQLKGMRGISANFENSSLASEIIEVIHNAVQHDVKEMKVPVVERTLSLAEKNLVDILKFVLNIIAEKENVAASLIATSEEITDFVRKKDVSFLSGWRYMIFGQVAEKISRGEISIRYDVKLGQAVLSELPAVCG